ncbi:MAG: hypothetical protein EHM61_14910 [Acidobacteria bacterium]|nr:MAG: hypothetical protein EHM61_14910 [Acidobacteriota bacterium]
MCPAPRNLDNWILPIAALVLSAAALVVLSIFNSAAFPIDDAFISFRYARNLTEGLGLVFNPGEKVEAYSNFLWTICISAFGQLGFSEVLAARLLGFASLIGVCLLCIRRLRTVTGSLLSSFLVALVFVSLPTTIFHTLSGMETMLSAFLLLATGTVLETEAGSRTKGLSAGILVGLYSLNRPEGLALFGCLLAGAAAIKLVKGKYGPHTGWFALSYGLAMLPFFAWRFLYYGTLLPNSVVAKSGFLHPLVLKAGAEYAARFLFWYAPVLLVAAHSFQKVALERLVVFRIPAVAAVSLTAILGGVGDGYPYSRYLYPLFPLLIIWATEGMAALRWSRAVRAGALLTLTLLQTGLLYAEQKRTALIANTLTSVDRLKSFFADGLPTSGNPSRLTEKGLGHYQAAGWLDENATPSQLLATYEIGIVPYFSRLRVLDLFGLADRHIARNPGLPGYRADLEYVWSRRPDFVMLRVPGDCLCSHYPLFFDRRLQDDFDLVGMFPYWTTDILMFRRREEPKEMIVYDLTDRNSAVPQVEGPILYLERIQLLTPEEKEGLIGEIRQTKSPDAMRRWMRTWRRTFVLPASRTPRHGSATFGLTLPPKTSLVFGIACNASQESWQAANGRTGRLEVRVRTASPSRLPEVVFEREFDQTKLTEGWQDRRIDLADFPAGPATVSFTIENHGIPRHLAFADPRIVRAD